MNTNTVGQPIAKSSLTPFPLDNLRFHPSKQGFADPESWSNGFQTAFAEAGGMVEKLLPLLRFPTVTLVARDHEDLFRRENGIPKWADAFSSGEEIYICSPLPLDILTPVLAHEIFHFGVTEHSASRPCLPDWFNESLAYLVQGETGIDHRRMRTYLKYDSKLVLALMLEDRILEESRFGIPLAKAFGRFLGRRYPQSALSCVLTQTFQSGDFYSSVVGTLESAPQEIIEKWLEHLAQEESIRFYEDPIRYVR